MNQELITLSILIGKFVLSSLLLVILYQLILRGKSDFNHSRAFLFASVFIALLCTQFNYFVYTPEARTVEVEAAQLSTISFEKEIKANGVLSASSGPYTGASPSFVDRITDWFTLPHFVLSVYLLVTAVLFILFGMQLSKIMRLKRNGELRHINGSKVLVNNDIPTPFSFMRTIFLNEKLTGEKLNVILRHEQWHIRHHHYLDAIGIEVLARLLWFNPLIWWMRKELRSISEYQTDRSVLNEGNDLYTYQSFILEEVMENNPYLANGLNHSFTKKRFIMMKNKQAGSRSTLRSILMVPVMIGVVTLFSFSIGETKVNYVIKKDISPQAQLFEQGFEPANANNLTSEDPMLTTDTVEVVRDTIRIHFPTFERALNNGEFDKLDAEMEKIKARDGKIWGEAYRIKPEQVIISPFAWSLEPRLLRIVNNKKDKETLVTIAVPIGDNQWWVRVDKLTELIDTKTMDRYLIRRLDNGLTLDKTMIVTGHKDEMIEITMVFPLLQESVEKVDLVERLSPDGDIMSNNSGTWSVPNIVVADYMSNATAAKVYK